LALPLISYNTLYIYLPLFNYANCLYSINKDISNWQVINGIDISNSWYKGNNKGVEAKDLRVGEGIGIFSS